MSRSDFKALLIANKFGRNQQLVHGRLVEVHPRVLVHVEGAHLVRVVLRSLVRRFTVVLIKESTKNSFPGYKHPSI